jgi:hypothetical protein
MPNPRGLAKTDLDDPPTAFARAMTQYDAEVGGIEFASLQANFGMIPYADAEASMKLFAREVMPHVQR